MEEAWFKQRSAICGKPQEMLHVFTKGAGIEISSFFAAFSCAIATGDIFRIINSKKKDILIAHRPYLRVGRRDLSSMWRLPLQSNAAMHLSIFGK